MPNSDHICTQVHGVYICTVSQLKLSGEKFIFVHKLFEIITKRDQVQLSWQKVAILF